MEFGDGGTAVSTTPKTTHRFAASSQYVVTLTVTDAGGLTGTQSSVIKAGR